MKTPLITLAITLLIAGCSSASSDLDAKNDAIQQEVLTQTQEEYLQSVQEEINTNASINQKAIENLDVKSCQKHSDQELVQTCEFQVIMTMSAKGDKSLCKMLPEGEEKQACLQD
jgi:PBP1b-binding outer membrane lipoprotein LpoB